MVLSFHRATVSLGFLFKGSAREARASGAPVGTAQEHLVTVNARSRNRWDRVTESCVCVCMCERKRVSLCVFSLVCSMKGQVQCICLFCALQVCQRENFQPPHKKIPSAQIVYNLSGLNVENYLVATANKFIRNRYMQPASCFNEDTFRFVNPHVAEF